MKLFVVQKIAPFRMLSLLVLWSNSLLPDIVLLILIFRLHFVRYRVKFIQEFLLYFLFLFLFAFAILIHIYYHLRISMPQLLYIIIFK